MGCRERIEDKTTQSSSKRRNESKSARDLAQLDECGKGGLGQKRTRKELFEPVGRLETEVRRLTIDLSTKH